MGRCIGGEYSAEQVDTALIAFIRAGTYKKAVELLANGDPPLNLHPTTIKGWIEPGGRHHTRFIELNEQLGADLEQEAVHNARRFLMRVAEKQEAMLNQFDPEKLEQRDIPAALRNIATVGALTVDKTILPLTGRDIASRQERGYDQLVDALRRVVLPQQVDSEAEVIDQTPAIQSAPLEQTRT